MKFCKRYQEFMQGISGEELPRVDLKRLKKILKRCRRAAQYPVEEQQEEDEVRGGGDEQSSFLRRVPNDSRCPAHCLVCDDTFYAFLRKEMSAVVDYFNKRARELLELHLTSGIRKLFMWFNGKLHHNYHHTLIEEGNDLVIYAIMNYIAMGKILKKYDKVHGSKRGQAFKSEAQIMHIGIFQSPWLYELIAFYVNLGEGKVNRLKTRTIPGLLQDCTLTLDGGRPTLSFGSFDAMKLEIDLVCSICLDTVFDAVSLTCGHIFCFMCCCSAASTTTVDGLQAADPEAKCPLCRRAGVYEGASHLRELNILLRRSCHEYWEQRLQRERVERVRQAKEHWESQCRAFMGI